MCLHLAEARFTSPPSTLTGGGATLPELQLVLLSALLLFTGFSVSKRSSFHSAVFPQRGSASEGQRLGPELQEALGFYEDEPSPTAVGIW